MWRAVAFTVCSASAVTILSFRSIWPRTTVAIGTSFVFLPTSACAATTEEAASGPARAASRRTWFPSASFAPRIALPSSLTCINAGWQASSPASRPAAAGAVNPARLISHLPTARSNAPASASVSTRQIVVFDGGGAAAAPLRRGTAGRARGITPFTSGREPRTPPRSHQSGGYARGRVKTQVALRDGFPVSLCSQLAVVTARRLALAARAVAWTVQRPGRRLNRRASSGSPLRTGWR